MRAIFLLALLLAASPAQADRLPKVGLYSAAPGFLRQQQLPNGGYQAHEVPFPPVVDLNTLRITLERWPCFGDCPIYKVEIRGDGTVHYRGDGNVAISGRHRTTISKAAIDQLLVAFRKARFFSLLDTYRAEITDSSFYFISIAFDGHKKKVEDYVGLMVGMPKVVAELEEAIDSTAGTDRWIKGSMRSTVELKAEGWDFAGQDDEHQEFIVNAVRSAEPNLVAAILDAGVKPKGRFGCEAVTWSIFRNNVSALKKLLHLGSSLYWNPPPDDRANYSCDVLESAVSTISPEILRIVLAYHPNVNRVNEQGDTPLVLLVSAARSKPDEDLNACVELLLAAGADAHVRDSKGRTVLDVAADEKSPAVPILKRWMEAHPQSR